MPTSPEPPPSESPLSESPSTESSSPNFLSPESPSSESPPPESPSLKFISPESLSPKPSLLKFISPASPSPKSPLSRPRSAAFVDQGLKVQVWLDALLENGGYNSGKGRGLSILCDNLLDIDSSQDWWQILRNIQQIVDLQFVSLLGASLRIVDVFVVWDGDVPPECDGWSKWSEWLKCKRWNDIGVKTMKLYKVEKGPRYRVNFEFLLKLLAERGYRDVIHCSLDWLPIKKHTPVNSMVQCDPYNVKTLQEW